MIAIIVVAGCFHVQSSYHLPLPPPFSVVVDVNEYDLVDSTITIHHIYKMLLIDNIVLCEMSFSSNCICPQPAHCNGFMMINEFSPIRSKVSDNHQYSNQITFNKWLDAGGYKHHNMTKKKIIFNL